MSPIRLAFFLALVGTAASACSSNNPVDSGTDTGAPTDAVMDVVTDTAVALPPQLFGSCASDSDCLAGDHCLTDAQGWPGGFCSRTCAASTDCVTNLDGVDGVCRTVGSQHLCLRSCLNGFSCENEGQTCHAISTSLMLCTPSCTDALCLHGTRCNHWTGMCEPTTAPNPPMGVPTGSPCTMSGAMSECRSQTCIAGVNSAGVPNGWNGGSCVSICALPVGYNVGSLFDPGSMGPANTLPQANCPMGSICFPNGAGEAERDEGICLFECHADTDCRQSEGYYCERRFQTAPSRYVMFNNGFCAPLDCLQTGMTCPMGYICEARTRSGTTTRYGVCRTAPPMPDGGTGDASSSDARPDVAGDVPSDTATPSDVAPADAAADVVSVDAPLDVSAD